MELMKMSYHRYRKERKTMKYNMKLLLAALTVLSVSLILAIFMSRHSASSVPQPSGNATDVGFLSTVGAPLSLERLTQKASLIVVGRVSELSIVGKISPAPGGKPQLCFATVQSDRVLKGSLTQPTLALKFTTPPSVATVGKGIAPSLYAMFFLSEESPHEYVLADAGFPSVVATKGAPPSQGHALERVVNELAYVLVSPDSPPSDQLEAVTAVGSVDSPAANAALHRALESKDLIVKGQAEAALLRHNDISVLKAVENILLRPPADFPDALVGRLASAIQFGVRDPKAVPALTHLLSVPDPRVRRAAAHALRETHAVAAIGPLSTALNDSDQMVRYDAVVGLAEITGDLTHAPSVDTFKRDENKYLTYWRERVR